MKYYFHYYIPTLDLAENESFKDRIKVLRRVEEVVESLLINDCDLHIEDEDEVPIPIYISVEIGTPSPNAEPIIMKELDFGS